ncbi:extensin family protein [Aquabacter sp. CN5-332]|uniref:extensin-like domain-containing protein n=1 Tax=Aquabacter sp. CN5-332 TaxID=3156608 RepID=UPI0032B4E303
MALLAWAMIAAPSLPAFAQTPLPKPRPGNDVPTPKPVPKRSGPATLPATPPPLPLPRPRELEKTEGATDAGAPKTPALDDTALAACLADFEARGGEAITEHAAPPTASEKTSEATTGDCAIPGPVTFARVKLPDGPVVTLDSAVTVRCTLALELASWIRDDLAPLIKRHGTVLARVTGVGGHACRPRNGQAGAQISEHASGNAFDLLGLKLADGRAIELSQADATTLEIREEVRKSACARFFTVLGPGADSSHANHVHLDLRQRRGGFRMCQWDVK